MALLEQTTLPQRSASPSASTQKSPALAKLTSESPRESVQVDVPSVDEQTRSVTSTDNPDTGSPSETKPDGQKEQSYEDTGKEQESSSKEEDDGWQAIWEESVQAYYFYNQLTGKSTWDNPRVTIEPSEPNGTPGLGEHDRSAIGDCEDGLVLR